MKTALLTTAAMLTAFAFPDLAVAGTVAGCETVAVEGSNYSVFVDPTCYTAPEGGSGIDGLFYVSFPVVTDDAEADDDAAK
jgi:hypothetical protein